MDGSQSRFPKAIFHQTSHISLLDSFTGQGEEGNIRDKNISWFQHRIWHPVDKNDTNDSGVDL